MSESETNSIARTLRHPFSMSHLSMAMNTVPMSGYRQPFLYQYLQSKE